jgi:hypothetical protein
MRKSLSAAMAAITFGGAVAAAAVPAQVQANDYRDYYYGSGHYHHHHNDTGAAVAAGVVGLALGAALASSSNHNGYRSGGYYSSGYAYDPYYGGGYYDRGYYDRGYSYDRGYYPRGYAYDRYSYRTCESSRWVWDPYIHERVLIRSRYAC